MRVAIKLHSRGPYIDIVVALDSSGGLKVEWKLPSQAVGINENVKVKTFHFK